MAFAWGQLAPVSLTQGYPAKFWLLCGRPKYEDKMFHKVGALAEKALFLGPVSGNTLTAGVCSMLFLPEHVEQADVIGQSRFCMIKS